MAQETTYNTVFETDEYAIDNGYPEWVALSNLALSVNVRVAATDVQTTLQLGGLPNENPLFKGQIFKNDTEYIKVVSIDAYNIDTPIAGEAEADITVERAIQGSTGIAIPGDTLILEQDLNLKIRLILESTHLIQNAIRTPTFEAGFDLVDPDDGSLLLADELKPAGILQTLEFQQVFFEYLQAKKIKVLSAGEYADAVFKMIERAGSVELTDRVKGIIDDALFDIGVITSGQFIRS